MLLNEAKVHAPILPCPLTPTAHAPDALVAACLASVRYCTGTADSKFMTATSEPDAMTLRLLQDLHRSQVRALAAIDPGLSDRQPPH